MILYFDNFISNIPLSKNFYKPELDNIRDSNSIYSVRDRYLITLYTLESYGVIDWSKVVIAYEFDKLDKSLVGKEKEFEEKIIKIFGKNKVKFFRRRSDTQEKYQEVVKYINKIDDDLIFYAGNNDHPIIANNLNNFNLCLDRAKKISKEGKLVSVWYSHFSEGYNMLLNDNPYHKIFFPNSKLLESTPNFFVGLFPSGLNRAILVMNKKLLNKWIFSKDLGNKIYKRIESMEWDVPIKNQYVIFPLKQFCEHFDGYSYTIGACAPIYGRDVPPLFIPSGFFESKIKIRYGYDDYKKGWVNVNPLKRKYIFDCKYGTDLKILLEHVPLFWKDKIVEIDINPNYDFKRAEQVYRKIFNKRKRPFIIKGEKGYVKTIFIYSIKTCPFISKNIKRNIKLFIKRFK